MYRSLHTTVIGRGGIPFEVQIRTWEMHRIAEYGVAAHWKYKSGEESSADIDDKLTWIRKLIETEAVSYTHLDVYKRQRYGRKQYDSFRNSGSAD